MYKRVSWEDQSIGRRLVDRNSGGRGMLVPGIVPDFVSWLRMIGNRYISMLESFESRYATKGDSFINSMRQTTEFRIALIQDLINQTVEQFPLKQWWNAVYQTCNELGLDLRDTDQNLMIVHPVFQDGEGI